jgi:hypothetical protein
MSSVEDNLFFDVSEDLLRRLGYEILLAQEERIKDIGKIEFCVSFKESKFFLPIKYAPDGAFIINCRNSTDASVKSELKILEDQVEKANQSTELLNHLKGKNHEKVSGSLLIARVDKTDEDVNYSENNCNYLWGMHRVFFYTMKISTLSWLEDWVSESNLGFVLKEEEFKQPLNEPFYGTVITGLRYGLQTERLKVTFAYFIDCIKNPYEVAKQIYTLNDEHIGKILDDAYSRLDNSIITELYPDQQMDVEIEIHAISGIEEKTEREVPDYAHKHKDWKKVNVGHLKIDEHTLFKYSVIPWESVLDIAYTKRTEKHTFSPEQIVQRLSEIEENFAGIIEESVKKQTITEPFNQDNFGSKFEEESYANIKPIFRVDCRKIPIKQNLILFTKSDILKKASPESSSQKLRVDVLGDIIKTAVADGKYSYNWIGILSASGFSTDLKDFVNNFSKPGIGLVLFDVVTKKIYVNKNSDEGKKANSMFLNIGIS